MKHPRFTLTVAAALALLGAGGSAWSQQQQRVDEARAALRERWDLYRGPLRAIELAYACQVVDKLSANAAMQRVEVYMRDDAVHAGLAADPMADQHAVVLGIAKAGRAEANAGACDRLTPAQRGRMRILVADLMRGGEVTPGPF